MAIGDAPSWQSLLGPSWDKYLNPSRYAREIANSQFNPVLNGLNMQRSRASLLRTQSNKAIQQAMAPVLAQYKAQAGQDATASHNASAGIASMAQQLAAGPGSSGNNAGLNNVAANYGGLVQAQGATQQTRDNSGLTQAQQRVGQLQANRQGELTSKMMDIDHSLVDARRAKADAYTKAFTEGLGMKQQLMSQALANRGAMINQDVLQGMAPEQLKSAKLANEQAKQNMIWQNLQGQQGMEMNDLQMKALKQQLAGAGIKTRSFFNNDSGTQQQILDGIMGQFIDPNSGGWKKGFDANKVSDSMYRKMAILFPGSASKHSAKLKKAIRDWVNSTNGISDPYGFNPDNANGGSDGGENSWEDPYGGYQSSPGTGGGTVPGPIGGRGVPG